ncbi:hypothetical protein AHAS_Ahas17G0200300 [Arachis hypogaea]
MSGEVALLNSRLHPLTFSSSNVFFSFLESPNLTNVQVQHDHFNWTLELVIPSPPLSLSFSIALQCKSSLSPFVLFFFHTFFCFGNSVNVCFRCAQD